MADRYMAIGKTMTQLMGLFVPFMKNVAEVFYQYDNDYVFNSDKFEKAFGMQPTSYRDGVTIIADSLRKPVIIPKQALSLIAG